MNEYQLTYDSLSKDCKEQYADLFNFCGAAFPGAEIYTEDNGRAYLIRVWQPLGITDSVDTAAIKYPPPIAALYDSLLLKLGKPNQVMNESPLDYANIFDVKQTIFWEGYHSYCRLYIDFGPNEGQHSVRIDMGRNPIAPKQEKLLK